MHGMTVRCAQVASNVDARGVGVRRYWCSAHVDRASAWRTHYVAVIYSTCANVARDPHMPNRTQTQTRSTNNNGDKHDRNGVRADDRSRRHGNPERTSTRVTRALEEMSELVRQMRTTSDPTERERVLQDDNFKLRKRNARLLDELESGGGIEEGMQAVSDDDVKELEAFREFKVKPADLKKMLDEHVKLVEFKQGVEAETLYAEIAEALDVVNETALVKLLQRENLHVEFQDSRKRDPDQPGKYIVERVPMCRPKGDDKAALVPLDQYIDEKLPEFIPALNAEPESDGDRDDADGASDGVADRTALSRRSTRDASTASEHQSETRTRGLARRSERQSSNTQPSGVQMPVARGERQQNGSRHLSDEDLRTKKLNSPGVAYSL